MNPQEQELLQQLNDVALPSDPGWWPPAPGWWLLLFVLLVLAGFIYWFVNRHLTRKRQDSWRRLALSEHQRLEQLSLGSDDQTSAIAELSVLMRRVALALEPRSRIAALTDEQWLAKLDLLGSTNQYTAGVGRVLYRSQYQRSHALDQQELHGLFTLTANTIKNASAEVHQPGGAPVAAR